MWLYTLVAICILCIIGSSAAAKFSKLDAITYNAALMGGIPNREARRDAIIEAMATSDTDFVCLQEVWYAEDVAAIVNGLSDVFPYSHSRIHNMDATVDGSPAPEDGPVCDATLIVSLLTCVQQHCPGLDYECLGKKCPQIVDVYGKSSDDCLICFAASLPNVEAILTSCCGSGGASALKKMNSLGLLIVSKERLTRTKTVEFFPKESELIPRGLLSAKVANRVNAVCTHLSDTSFDYAEINLFWRFSSYKQQRAYMYEIGRLVTKYTRKNKLLLLGDFNVAPAGPGDLLPFDEDHYQILNSTFATQIVGCTYCPRSENIYNPEYENYAIDHVFTRRLQISRVRRVFTTAESSYYVNGTQMPMSDHFGVAARLTKMKRV